MIRFILAQFGYCKVPLAAVRLSILQENFFRAALKHAVSPQNIKCLNNLLEGQTTLTNFLRSGRF